MSLGNVTINFDEEQLKRFEAAAASIPDAMLEKQTNRVTIDLEGNAARLLLEWLAGRIDET